MHEFLTYFLSHRPSNEEWIAFLLVNLVAYVAARNTVLRRQRRAEKIAYAQQLARLEAKQSAYRRQIQQEQQRLVKEQWVMIQQQAKQIQDLTHQLKAIQYLHLN